MMNQITRTEAREKGLTRYFTGKPCKYGHISERMVSTKTCVNCKSVREKTRKKRVLTKSQRERKNELARARRLANPEKHRKYSLDWYQKNKDAANKKRSEYDKWAMAARPEYAMRRRVSALINQAIRSNNFSKKSKTRAILGCSNDEFKRHIEMQFKDGMGWHNRDQWHLDHIIPISSAETEGDVYALSHYTNIRPLWAGENLKKSDSMEFLL